MSAPYHTSGPWVLGREIGGYVDIDAPHALVKWTALARVVIETEAVNGYTRNAEAEANAHLIAAAPCLLEALEIALNALKCASRQLTQDHKIVLGGKVWGGGDIKRIEAAIAKARGGAS